MTAGSWPRRCSGLGRDDEADLELQAARDEFHRLGAIRDEAAADDAMRAAAARGATPTIAHKTFMFTDIVASTNLAEAMGDEAWEHLLRWHDDALRAVFVDNGGEVVNSTGDGFFVAFDSASSAINCAAGGAARARRAAPDPRVRSCRAHRPSLRSSDPSGLGLQRQGCARRREDRRACPRRGDSRLLSDGRDGRVPANNRTTRSEPEGRVRRRRSCHPSCGSEVAAERSLNDHNDWLVRPTV